ncbi:MAG: hypothetical protein H7Y10_15335 [Flavobacterium sp.]|nr:hypothetical protein [Flavobacterium sp.]
MNTYKSYQINLQLYDGTFFIKSFKKNTKQEYIKLVNVVRKEIFDNQMESNIRFNKTIENSTIEEEFVFSDLNIKFGSIHN